MADEILRNPATLKVNSPFDNSWIYLLRLQEREVDNPLNATRFYEIGSAILE